MSVGGGGAGKRLQSLNRNYSEIMFLNLWGPFQDGGATFHI